MATIKQKRLEGIIRKNVSDIIQFGVKDPNVGFITITDVSVSKDHSYATIYVSFLGKEERGAAGMKALERAKGYIRSELSKRLSIRRCPELIFEMDEAMKYGQHIDEIIAKIHQEEE
ncbi:MAG: 30S ribosome-binding factor RbfA [Solobacterium sp.]|jgi:ribosome-binding factor A|nr:30S ribosome-binding factor RbfA [Solobacterium sp.]